MNINIIIVDVVTIFISMTMVLNVQACFLCFFFNLLPTPFGHLLKGKNPNQAGQTFPLTHNLDEHCSIQVKTESKVGWNIIYVWLCMLDCFLAQNPFLSTTFSVGCCFGRNMWGVQSQDGRKSIILYCNLFQILQSRNLGKGGGQPRPNILTHFITYMYVLQTLLSKYACPPSLPVHVMWTASFENINAKLILRCLWFKSWCLW